MFSTKEKTEEGPIPLPVSSFTIKDVPMELV
jgi:hypothetical protein